MFILSSGLSWAGVERGYVVLLLLVSCHCAVHAGQSDNNDDDSHVAFSCAHWTSQAHGSMAVCVCGSTIELQTTLREDFTIKEKGPT